MAKYRVKTGQRHGFDGQYGPGDVVEMEPEAFIGLEDKLEAIGPEATPPPVDQPDVVDESADEAGEEIDDESAEEPEEEYPASVYKAVEGDPSVEVPGDLVFLNDEELLAIKGIGEKAVAEIREFFPYSG